MLQHLGLGPRIVGKHGFDLAADPSAIVCGDQGGIDYEALLRVRPTHILIQKGAEELPERLKTLANENGWQVFVYPLLTLSEIQAAAVSLHTLFPPTPSTLPEGAPTPESEQRREILLAFDHLLDRYTGRFSGAGRILLLESIAPPAGPGPGSFHQQILERLGGTPAITTGKPYITMDAEDVLRLAPDGIIIFAPRKPGTPAEDPGPEELLTRLGRLGTLDIPAVKNRRIALIDEPFALTPSTALIEVGQRIEQILTRWQSR
jgi:ABC-type Fe3+-hydroxamate transport system substrate-binding protein